MGPQSCLRQDQTQSYLPRLGDGSWAIVSAEGKARKEPNEKGKGFKMQEQGPERCPRKQSIPTRLIIPRVDVCCLVQGMCSVLGYPRMRKQRKVPQSLCLPLPSHCGILGLTDLQSNPVPSHFNFHEVIFILKAPLELHCFQKMFGLGAAGLQVPGETKGKCVCKA